MMYYANFRRNNGECLCSDLFGTNKRKLITRISSAAREGTFAGNEYSWLVWDANGIIVGAGAGRLTYDRKVNYLYYKHLIGTLVW